MVGHGLRTPYLLNELLALAAMHLSRIRPPKRDHYHYNATQLQTHAISIFNETDAVLTEENCTSVFLFSSVLGAHLLCETLTSRSTNLSDFLGRFIQYTNLSRGVRTVASQARGALDQSDLGGLWRQNVMNVPLCNPYAKLLETITSAKLGSQLTDIYKTTIDCLQSVTNFDRSSSQQPIISWPVRVSDDYLECLTLYRPEALVIFAYYAVLLHLHRDLWVFGDSGIFIINSITRYLGSEWSNWMEWPQQQVQHTSVDS
jgi:hypothetical protein